MACIGSSSVEAKYAAQFLWSDVGNKPREKRGGISNHPAHPMQNHPNTHAILITPSQARTGGC